MTYEEWVKARKNGVKIINGEKVCQSFYDKKNDIFCGGGCEEEEPE